MVRKVLYGVLLAGLIAAPFLGVYPVFMMKVLCFALLAAAFNLLIGYTGLLSFGHAMFLASAGYSAGYAIQTLGFTPELGVIEGLTRVFYPEASATVVFVIMALVLLVRPAGLFGKEK